MSTLFVILWAVTIVATVSLLTWDLVRSWRRRKVRREVYASAAAAGYRVVLFEWTSSSTSHHVEMESVIGDDTQTLWMDDGYGHGRG